MQKLVREYLNELKSRQKKRRRTGIAAILLIVLVVGGVIGVLTQYGVAMTGDLKCRIDEHQHSEACYSNEITCGQEEQSGHMHTDECYQTETELVCGQEESAGHAHTPDCYGEDGTLVCGQEESAGHVHTDDCYQTTSVLVCGQEESEGHTHTEDCRTKQLICGKEEHQHTEQCYSDTEAGVEDASVWEAQYEDTEWKDTWGENLVIAAKQQIGYKENSDNYSIAEDGTHKGYTRYGQFAENVYADWDAAFVNFCMYYAGMKESNLFPDETDTEKWIEEYKRIHEQNAEYLSCLISAEGYTPEAGDLVFFEKENEETEKQMGIVSSYNKEKNEIEVIEGNCGNEVKENKYQASDEDIVSYLKITEMEEAYKGIEDIKKEEEPQDKSAMLNRSVKIRSVSLAEDNGDGNITRKAHKEPAVIKVPGSEKGTIELRLYYGRNETTGAANPYPGYPDNYKNDAHWGADQQGLPGYFTIMLNGVEGDITLGDVTMTIHIPKEFIKEGTPKFAELSQDNQDMIPLGVTEDAEYYHLKMQFPDLKNGSLMGTTFSMYYVGGLMPEGYELHVNATLEYKYKDQDGNEQTLSDDTGENIYCPTYQKPELVKYANTNKENTVEMAKDGVMIAATVNKDGIVEDTDYASFWYNIKTEPWYMREYEKIILTDTLPTYPKILRDETTKEPIRDEDGNIQTETAVAYFDAAANPDWEVIERNEKGIPTKVQYNPITTDLSCATRKDNQNHWLADLKLGDELMEAELKLKFPDCLIDEKIETATGTFFKKELTNSADITCYRRNPCEGEAECDYAKDDLKFVLTDQPVGLGLAKYNTAKVVLDTKDVREGFYRWGIKVTNNSDSKPFKEIVITDTDLDERLKLSRIQVETKDYGHIKKVIAVAEDGKEYTYTKEQFNQLAKNPVWGNSEDKFCYELNWTALPSEVEFKGFKIYMNDGKDEQGKEDPNADDYHLNKGEGIEIAVYSTFKDPGKSHYNNTDTTKNVYHNGAIVEYWRGNTKVTGWTGNDFMLQKMTEDVWIEKNMPENISLDKDEFCYIRIKGSLLDSKDYKDLKVVDMLPEGLTLSLTGEGKIAYGSGSEYIERTEVIPNYNGLGRTAVIFHLNVEEVRKALDGRKGHLPNGAQFTFRIKAPSENAVEGSYLNYAFLHSDDFESIKAETTVPHMDDIYGIAGTPGANQIRYGSRSGIIGSFDSTYLEKWIAPEGSNAWLKNESLPLTVGESFQYRLDIVNGSTQKLKGIKAYDVLPEIGDSSIANSQNRNSEYTVRLKGPLNGVGFDGYTVSYTTSNEVYTHSMAEIMAADGGFNDIWLSENQVTDWNDVTAFKIVGDNTEINAKDRVQFVIPVKVTDVLSGESMNKLKDKESEDQTSGTITYLEATNSFGYSVGNFTGSDKNNLESNYVKSRIPFAGFVVKKVDSEDKSKGLNGAKFKLEKLVEGTPDDGTWEIVVDNQATQKVGEVDGIVSFKNLVTGTYRLTETQPPNGYSLIQSPITVTITQDSSSKFYTVTMDGIGEDGGKGNSTDPFIVVNWKTYELPSTGGVGIYWYMFGGVLLMLAAALMTYRNKCKEVLRS